MRSKKILSVLKSDDCKKRNKECAKAIKNKLKHHKRSKSRSDKKHHHKRTSNKTTITNKIYINNPKDSAEKDLPKATPNPPPTAQGVRSEMPYQSLFNERVHFMDLIKGIKAEHSKFKDIYNASRTPTFETTSMGIQTDHTGDIPKKSGPKGPRKPKMNVDSGTDTDFLMTPEQQRDGDYLALQERKRDEDLKVESMRYRGKALRGSPLDRLDTFSDGTPHETPKRKKKGD